MTFYLMGLGLDLDSLSIEAFELLEKCKKIYIENYTVEFPYKIQQLENLIGKKIIPLTRIIVEKEDFIDDAGKGDIVLLVYGSPLTATTHISLILKCEKEGLPYRVFHNASIFDAVAESGLQIYKFGKTASMPKWEAGYQPDSFKKIVLDNQKIGAHTLILIDIGVGFSEALNQLKKVVKGMNLGKIVVCSQLGTKQAGFHYSRLNDMHLDVPAPFCFILPGKLHFLEEEVLEKL